MELDAKLAKLREIIAETGGLAVAFSGGLDSTFLAAMAEDVLGARALAVTALSPTYPAREQSEAVAMAARIGITHIEVESNELEIEGFADNPPDRCYHCKRELFTLLRATAKAHGIEQIADGTNVDDESDYRPGRRAGAECGVLAPLLQAELTKAEIRELSRRMGLPTADKPSFACLASRFPYGTRITAEKLGAVDAVEEALGGLGIRQVRVRHHGDICRIEVEPGSIARFTEPAIREQVVAAAKRAGFHYVALDLEGYRTGSMNEPLGAAGGRGARTDGG